MPSAAISLKLAPTLHDPLNAVKVAPPNAVNTGDGAFVVKRPDIANWLTMV
jgi:hypothetical protein